MSKDYICKECGAPKETRDEEGMLVIESCKSCPKEDDTNEKDDKENNQEN